MKLTNKAAIAAGNGASLELRELCKKYPRSNHAAVDHVNLSVEAGEFLTLLGPSGSGKTTVLNMIAGIVEATDGSILVDDEDVSRIPPERRNFGMVFQNYALFPHMTVSQNVTFPLRQRKVPRLEAQKQVADALDMMDLAGLGERHPHELSGGQQQRVALARALVFSPRLLLLDEPLAALDRKLRQSLQVELKRLHDRLGLTFIFVTHDQDEAMFLSDRIAVFNNGHCEAVGAPAELYNNPVTLFVAQFLGESNVFRGQVVDDGSYQWREHRWSLSPGHGRGDVGDVLVVRPENLQVLDASSRSAGEMNQVRARVIASSYLGAFARLDVDFESGDSGSVVLPPKLAARAAVGEAVTLAWRPEDQSLVRADEASSLSRQGASAGRELPAEVRMSS